MLVAPGPTDEVAIMIWRPTFRLCKRHRGQGHGLLVVPPPRWQLILDLGERLGQRYHVAVAKDPKDPREKGNLHTIDLGALRYQPAHNRLSRGESDSLHRHYSLMRRQLIVSNCAS